MAWLHSLRGKPDLLLAVDVRQDRERITTVAAAAVGVRDLVAVVVAVDLDRETKFPSMLKQNAVLIRAAFSVWTSALTGRCTPASFVLDR